MTITNRVSLKSVMAGNTPIDDVVDAPTIGTATAGVESATVTFTAAATGGAATSFGAISTPGSITGTSATSPITVSGLTGGTAYTFQTYGINSSGTWSNVLSAASNSVTPTVGSSYESIATITVGSGGSSSVEFTSIPQTYKHLQIRALARSTSSSGANASNEMWIRFNSDTASNYASHELNSYGTGSQSYAKTSTSGPRLSLALPRDATTANVYGSSIITILDYTNTGIYKTARTLYGWNAGGSHTGMSSVHWRSTAAITTITFLGEQDNFKQHTTFALYGIKG